MIQAFVHGQLQSGLEDVARLARHPLGGVAQQFEAGVGDQGLLSAGLAEVVLADYELHATPLSLLFPAGRRRSARVEVVAQFLQEVMA